MFGVSHIWVVLKPLPHDTYEPLFHNPQNYYSTVKAGTDMFGRKKSII